MHYLSKVVKNDDPGNYAGVIQAREQWHDYWLNELQHVNYEGTYIVLAMLETKNSPLGTRGNS